MHPDNALMHRPSVLHIGTTWLVAAAILGLLLSACSPEEPAAIRRRDADP